MRHGIFFVYARHTHIDIQHIRARILLGNCLHTQIGIVPRADRFAQFFLSRGVEALSDDYRFTAKPHRFFARADAKGRLFSLLFGQGGF